MENGIDSKLTKFMTHDHNPLNLVKWAMEVTVARMG
jgi:hypothetical protein